MRDSVGVVTGHGSVFRWAQAMFPIPRWAVGVLTASAAITALLANELPGWAWWGLLPTLVTAVALLGLYPIVSLGLCAEASVATAAAMAHGVPVWSVAIEIAICVISLVAGRLAPRPVPALCALTAGAALGVLFPIVSGGGWGTGLFMLGSVVALPWMIGRSHGQQAELMAIAVEQARLRERNRIARDMHDTLGHELSLLALRAGALEMAPDLAERHRRAAAEIRIGAGEATERLAEILAMLRDDEPAPLHPAAERVEDLVDRAAQAGLPISLERHGTRRPPPWIERAACRVVQEALTNAAKHAPGHPVQVRLTTEDDATTATVVNALPPDARPGAGGRLGLAGLHEHVRLVGGTLQAGPRGREFEVAATLPHKEEK